MAPYRFRVRIYTPKHGGQGDLPGLFDMLRYDRAQVIDWDHVSETRSPVGEHYTLTLTSPAHPTVDRWNSFRLVVTDITEV